MAQELMLMRSRILYINKQLQHPRLFQTNIHLWNACQTFMKILHEEITKVGSLIILPKHHSLTKDCCILQPRIYSNLLIF